jgi:signal transduction histidine kinase
MQTDEIAAGTPGAPGTLDTPEAGRAAAETPAGVEGYRVVLGDYLKTHNEAALYRASMLSQALVESGIGPEEIVALHFEALEEEIAGQPYRERLRANTDSYQFLLEVMIAYGVQYKQYVELRLTELAREAEARATLERQRLEEAQQAAQEKADLLAVVAHELRTPLTAARGNVDMAVRSIARGRVERVEPLLTAAREAIDRLSRLTADLVEASRGGPLQLQRVPQDLVQLMAQACRWARAAAVSKGLSLEWEREPLHVTVLGDADALLSVFGNLLSNAVRYTSSGGITVRHGIDEAMGMAWVCVGDTGVGMAPDVRQRIFDKFYRAPEARTLGGQGLGLGLSLVDQFVRAHKGRVEVESEPGTGSTFRVWLPLAAGAASPGPTFDGERGAEPAREQEGNEGG